MRPPGDLPSPHEHIPAGTARPGPGLAGHRLRRHRRTTPPPAGAGVDLAHGCDDQAAFLGCRPRGGRPPPARRPGADRTATTPLPGAARHGHPCTAADARTAGTRPRPAVAALPPDMAADRLPRAPRPAAGLRGAPGPRDVGRGHRLHQHLRVDLDRSAAHAPQSSRLGRVRGVPDRGRPGSAVPRASARRSGHPDGDPPSTRTARPQPGPAVAAPGRRPRRKPSRPGRGRRCRTPPHRVRSIDGTFRISSPAGGPTTIAVELPCEL